MNIENELKLQIKELKEALFLSISLLNDAEIGNCTLYTKRISEIDRVAIKYKASK